MCACVCVCVCVRVCVCVCVVCVIRLTVVVDGVNKADPHMGVVVRDQNNVEQLFTLRVQLPQAHVHRLQSLLGKKTQYVNQSDLRNTNGSS